jgi:hypothetical protein
MATFTRCYSPIRGRVVRITLLNSCGATVTGASSAQITTGGFTQVAQTAQYDTGAEHITRRADAQLCVNEKDPDYLKRLQLTFDLCSINPGIIANTVAGARLLTYSQSPTGTGFAIGTQGTPPHFSLEVWQDVAGQACDSSGNPLYVYNAWPNLANGKIGDYNIGLDPSQIQIIAESFPVWSGWTTGNTWLGSGAVQAIPDHWFQNLTSTAPPAESCTIITI